MKKLNLNVFVLMGMALTLIVGLMAYERFKSPTLGQLQTAFAIIEPNLSDLTQLNTNSRSRAWFGALCDINTGIEACPSHEVNYILSSLELSQRLDKITETLTGSGWTMVRQADDTGTCQLSASGINQYSQTAASQYGDICQRVFYKDSIKLAATAPLDSKFGTGRLLLTIRLIDAGHEN